MQAHVRRKETYILLELSGRVDDFHSDVVRDELETILGTGRTRIAIDLAGVTSLSARCVLDWLAVYERLLQLGGGIVLIRPRGAALELVQSCGLDVVLPIVESLDDLTKVEFPLFRDPSTGSWWSRVLRVVGLGLVVSLLGASGLRSFPAQAAGESPTAVPTPASSALDSAPALTLSEAQKIAKERSPFVRLARARFEEKDADFEIARRSPLPKFTGTMGYLFQTNPNALTTILNKEANQVRSGDSGASVNELQTRNSIQIERNAGIIGIGALQILYAGGYFDAKRDLAVRERELGEVDVRIAELELETLVRDLFLGIVLLEEKQRLLDGRVNAQAARVAALQRALASRAVAESLVTEAEIDGLKSRREARENEGELSLRRGQFNALLGRPEGMRVTVSGPESKNLGLAPTKQIFQAALARHPVVAQGLKRIAASESYIQLVRSQEMFVPKAFAFGGVDHTRGIGNTTRVFNWSIGVGVLVPLYDGGTQAEETRKALALRSQAETSYEIATARIKEQSHEAELKLALAVEGVTLAQRATELAARGVVEATGAAGASQIPQFKLEEIKARRIEADLALLAARTELVRWQSVMAQIAGVGP